MNAATQRNRHAALLKASGFEDGPALTVQSTDGEIPHGRELSFAWLTGTVLTGLTSVLLMGAALYVSFQGQDTFSTAYEALQIITNTRPDAPTNAVIKSSRPRPVAQTKSDLEIVEASIRENVGGRDMIRKQPFARLRATLATAATSLSDDVPAYDPVAMISASQPSQADDTVSTDIYAADVEGEVAVKLAAMPMTLVPPSAISDDVAAAFVRTTVEGAYTEREPNMPMLAYASAPGSLRDLGIVKGGALALDSVENVTAIPKTTTADEAGLGRTERMLTVKEASPLADVLKKNGFSDARVGMIKQTLSNILPDPTLPGGARLRILFGPGPDGKALIPYRLSIYISNQTTKEDRHIVTLASANDDKIYAVSVEPPAKVFPEEDTEDVNVANLPSIYRAIWETGRKHDLPDATIQRIVGMYAYDLDLTKKIAAGDSIEILQTAADPAGKQELLYVGLNLGSSLKELFRFRADDGTVDFFDPDGETGKRFLTRRPVQGGGTLRSRFGYRIHPIFKSRKLHTGVDLAAKTGTPIYASGDGVIEKAGWSSGYGKYVLLKHVNGFETGYGHMSRIADTMKPGTRVRQGQVIGYVGSTGYSTGPHLHFEIKINGNFVDPLSVKLPRDKSLPGQYEQRFAQTVTQIRELMKRDAAPMTVASN